MISVTSAPLAGSTVVVVIVSRSRFVDPVMDVDVLADVTGRLVTVVLTVGALGVVVDFAALVTDSVTPNTSLNAGLVSVSVAASGSSASMSLLWQVALLLRHTFGSLSDRLERRMWAELSPSKELKMVGGYFIVKIRSDLQIS